MLLLCRSAPTGSAETVKICLGQTVSKKSSCIPRRPQKFEFLSLPFACRRAKLLRTEISEKWMSFSFVTFVLLGVGSLRFLEVPCFDEFFWRIFLTNSFNESFWLIFFTKLFYDFFLRIFWRIFFTNFFYEFFMNYFYEFFDEFFWQIFFWPIIF